MRGLTLSNFPSTPIPGLVFRYPYLWKSEKAKNQLAGFKRRPCVVVIRHGPVKAFSGRYAVDVAPMTHSPQDGSAVEVPHRVKSIMRLDDDSSWIVTSEMNRFVWPYPDQFPVYMPRNDRPKQWHWGVLPQDIFKKVVDDILKAKEDKDNIITRPSF